MPRCYPQLPVAPHLAAGRLVWEVSSQQRAWQTGLVHIHEPRLASCMWPARPVHASRSAVSAQAHAAAGQLQEGDAGAAEGAIDACELGSSLYTLAVSTLVRVQALCANPHGLSKWALEMLHDQGWKVAPPRLCCSQHHVAFCCLLSSCCC